MRDDRQLFQLYLLSQMRNKQGIKNALRALRASTADFPRARRRMLDLGLERVGAPLATYEELLGTKAERGGLAEAGPGGHLRLIDRFDLWPTMNVVILGSLEGVSSGVRFEQRAASRETRAALPTDLVPWANVRDDIPAQWSLTTRDEWYPMLDIEVEVPTAGGRFLLQFDFELLQAIHALGS